MLDFFMTTTFTDNDFAILFENLGKQTFDILYDNTLKVSRV